MTRAEQKLNSITKEIEKLNERIARTETRLEKKIANAEKVNARWTREQYWEHRDANEVSDRQFSAYFEMTLVEGELEDLKGSLERAQKRLEKASGNVSVEHELKAKNDEIAKIGSDWAAAIAKKSAEEREREYQKWLAEFKARCAKDGVTIDEAEYHVVKGLTKSGKRFWMFINNGVTERSLHCYSLDIDGKTIFTSGDFSTAYREVRRR